MDLLLLAIILISFFATLVRSTLGFGESLIAVPLFLQILPLSVAVPLSVLISVLVALIILVQDHKNVHLKGAKGLILFGILGLPLGLWLLLVANASPVKMALGLILMIFSIYSLLTKKKRHLTEDSWTWMGICGFLSGILGGAYGLNGPPLIYYGNIRQWQGPHFRATLQAYFLPMSFLGVLGYSIKGLVDQQLLFYFLVSLPGVIPAVLLGRYLNKRLFGPGFFKYVYVLLTLLGLILVLQNI